ncbi:hypothetical protein O181_111284 [Austropuccinia psidii MF-1]|uniref:Integrase catalytic domain-containing protein n=1 Tax=Austropuccinia psidii MF-1 TaxID=1389203 RepID=A0A9Q3K1P1_9BASI|nr:hypothetical protein [Austropuccinia psidii MF-1]
MELAYETSAHSSTGQTPAILEKAWNPRLPPDTLRKDLIDIHPTASSFKKWDKSHKIPDFKVGDLVPISTLNFNNIKGQKKIKYSYVGPFVISALHQYNAVQVELSGELEIKHPTFPVSLTKTYQPTEKELFPLRNPAHLTVPPVKQDEDKKIKKFIKERRLRGKNK